MAALIDAMRPYQWIKNILLLLPLVLAHRVRDIPRLCDAVLAFGAWSLCASAVYIFNDLRDIEDDRRHPTKRFRPFAAGRAVPRDGLALAAILLGCATLIAASVHLKFLALMYLYLALTLAYSLRLKRTVLVDVMLLAALYTLRIIAGAYAVNVPLTMWLLAFSMFLFLSLAFAKRYAELAIVSDAGGDALKGRGYQVRDLRVIESVGPAAGYLAVLVFCNYLETPLVRELYRRPHALWLIAPLLLYWITRVWFVACRRQMDDDPILFAVRDRVSLLVGILIAMLVFAAWAPLPLGRLRGWI